MTNTIPWASLDTETFDSGWRPEGLPAWEPPEDDPEARDLRGSVDPRMGQIATVGLVWREGNRCIGWCGANADLSPLPRFPDIDDLAYVAVPCVNEADLLARAWQQLANVDRFHTWRGGFEKVWLRFRSMARKVEVRHRLWNPRFDTRSTVVDWADHITQFGAIRTKGVGLRATCEALGLPLPWGSGKEVQEWVEAGDWESVVRHQMTDCVSTLALGERCGPIYLV